MGRSRFSSPLTALVPVAHEGIHPMNMLPPPMVALVTLEENGYSRGRCPVNRFPWILNNCKLFMSLTHNGNSPDSRLSPSHNLDRLTRFPSSDGIGPLSLLPLRYSRSRLDSCLSSGGIDPVRSLLASHSVVRLARFPSSDGIDPVRLWLERFSCVRLDSCPSSGGSVPFSGGESGPGRRSHLTRCGVPPAEIPFQLDIAVDAFQFRVEVPRRVSLAVQRALQSAMRPVFV